MSGVDRYAVVGNPVQHSLSPEIHQAFAAQFGERIRYDKIEVPPGGFSVFADAFFAEGGAGFNVTVPFKTDAFAYVTRCDGAAAAARAVNTVALEHGACIGFNTDGAGLVNDLTGRHGQTIDGARVLILGAGGATRGVVEPLLALRPERLTIANRTLRTAEEMVAYFTSRGAHQLHATGFDDLNGRVDIIINATSAGLQGAQLPIEAAFARGAFCYDMSYGPGATFYRWARALGEQAADGLGMLVEQAALAYRVWRSHAPATEPVMRLLRERLAAPAERGA